MKRHYYAEQAPRGFANEIMEDDNPREQKLDPTREYCLIAPQSDVDVSAIMAAYKERGWNGSTMIQPFASVADARAFVRSFRKSCERGQVA